MVLLRQCAGSRRPKRLPSHSSKRTKSFRRYVTWTLASAGVIKGRRLTSYWDDGVPEDIKVAGGKWEDEEVVVDGNLITSRWPMDLPRLHEGNCKSGRETVAASLEPVQTIGELLPLP